MCLRWPESALGFPGGTEKCAWEKGDLEYPTSGKQKRVDGWIFTTIPLCGARCISVECNKSLQLKGSKKSSAAELQQFEHNWLHYSVHDLIRFFCSLTTFLSTYRHKPDVSYIIWADIGKIALFSVRKSLCEVCVCVSCLSHMVSVWHSGVSCAWRKVKGEDSLWVLGLMYYAWRLTDLYSTGFSDANCQVP